MLRLAKEILATQTTRQVNQLLLEDGDPSECDEDATRCLGVPTLEPNEDGRLKQVAGSSCYLFVAV